MSTIQRIVWAVVVALMTGAALVTAANVRCLYTGERVSGLNKICYYDCLGSAAAITIKSTELCPLSIER